MKGTPWTEAEIATLREMRAAGASQKQIGQKLGRSKGSVARQVGLLELPLPEGKTPALHPAATPKPQRPKPLRRGAKTLPSLA